MQTLYFVKWICFFELKNFKSKNTNNNIHNYNFFHYFSEAPGLAVTLTLKMKSFRVSKTDICVC